MNFEFNIGTVLNQLCENSVLTDCRFLLQEGDTMEEVKAHKLVLAAASSVFRAMFFGALPETTDPIHLVDVKPKVFVVFLK